MMKIATCFLAIACCVVALPADVPFEAFEEDDLSKVMTKDNYKESVNAAKTPDLPGTRLIGGIELAPHTAPYQVAILVNGKTLVSGSLISRTKILTTASSVYSASYAELILGAHYYNQTEDTQKRITSTNIFIHEQYHFYGIPTMCDIALVFLPQPIYTNDYIDVVALPLSGANYEGKWGLLSGWGSTSLDSDLTAPALRGAYVEVLGFEACEEVIGVDYNNADLCTAAIEEINTCQGDTGDPLVVDGVLIGLSRALSCQQVGGQNLTYTSVSSYRDWIDSF